MHLRFGGERYTYTWSEAAVVLGLVLVPFPHLVLVAPLSVALTHSLSGRQPMKVYYNAMSMAIAVTVARYAMVPASGHSSISSSCKRTRTLRRPLRRRLRWVRMRWAVEEGVLIVVMRCRCEMSRMVENPRGAR